MHLASRIAHLRLENSSPCSSSTRSRSRSHSPVFRPPTLSDSPDTMVQPRSTRSTVRRQPRSRPAPQWQRVACRMIVAIFGISIALYISNLESEAIGKATETSVEQHARHDHDEFVDDNAQSNQAPGVSGADEIKSEGDFHSQKKELYQKPGGTGGTADKRQEMLDKLRSRREERTAAGAGGGLHHDHSIHGVNQPPEIAGMMDNLRGNGVKGDDDDDDDDDSATATASDDSDGDEDEDSVEDDDDDSATATASDGDGDSPDDSDEDGDEDSPDDMVDRDTPGSPSVDTDGDDDDSEDDATEATNGDESKDDGEDSTDDDVVHTEDSPSKKDVEGDTADDDVVRDEPLVKPKTKVKVRLDREDEDDSGEDSGEEEEDAGTGDIVDTEASPSKKDLDSDEDKDGDDGDDEDDEGVVEQGPPTATDEGEADSKKKTKNKKTTTPADVEAKSHGGFAQPAYSATTKTKPKVGKIALLGERNTGTRWMSAQLEECFPSLKVTPRLLRWKHWFQEDDGLKHDDTLVISQFRNVYEWTEAMRVVPHHAPMHVKLDWKDFVTKAWTMKRPKRDLPFKDSKEQVCFEKFKYNQLISCIEGSRNDTSYVEYGCDPDRHYSCHKPIYELKQDDSGDPYENILEMRADKIRNFVLDIKKWDWIADVIPVQYETLLSNGTDFLISRVEEATGVKRKCKAVGAQVRKRRVLDPEMIEWLNDHVDWEAEALVEYKKWDKQGTADKNDEIGEGKGEGDSLATELSESADEKEGGKKSAEVSDEGEDADGKKLKSDVKGEAADGGGKGEDSVATEVSASADERDEGEGGNKDLDVKDEDVSGEKVASKKRMYT